MKRFACALLWLLQCSAEGEPAPLRAGPVTNEWQVDKVRITAASNASASIRPLAGPGTRLIGQRCIATVSIEDAKRINEMIMHEDFEAVKQWKLSNSSAYTILEPGTKVFSINFDQSLSEQIRPKGSDRTYWLGTMMWFLSQADAQSVRTPNR